MVPILIGMKSVHIILSYLVTITLILFLNLFLVISNDLPSRFPITIMYAFLVYFMRATCLTHLIYLDFIAVIIFCELFPSIMQYAPAFCDPCSLLGLTGCY
jgi:hypothetical protein